MNVNNEEQAKWVLKKGVRKSQYFSFQNELMDFVIE